MNAPAPLQGFPPEVFAARRAKVFEALGSGAMVLPAAPVLHRSRDTEVRYRPDSELFYVTGATEPGTVAVLFGTDCRLVLFVRGRDAEAERWSGPRLGPEGAADRLGADEAHDLASIGERLPALLAGVDRVFARLGSHGFLDRAIVDALRGARTKGSRKGTGPRAVVDPGQILDDLRLVKEPGELARIRRATELTVVGHRAGAAALRPGVGEWVVEAAVEAVFRRGGAQGPAFPTIVGSGPNACVLHYAENARTIGEDELVLLDAGAEAGLYHADVSRTLPASGRFSGPQRDVYQLVEAAREAAVRAVRPGADTAAPHAAATRVLVGGLTDLGILSGSIEELLAGEAHRPYFPHQTSHWLGLDVHDPGDYARAGVPRILAPGMVLTVEPGLYFAPHGAGEPTPFDGIGVRLEDDVLVTSDGAENLTASLPTEPDAVEALVGKA